MKYFSFVDSDDASLIPPSYLDVARALTRTANLKLGFAPIGFADVGEKTIWLSRKWISQEANIQDTCLRAELYLYSLSFRMTSFSSIDATNYKYPRFFLQMVLLTESIRITQELVAKRPGTRLALQKYYILCIDHVVQQGTQFISAGHLADAILAIFHIQCIIETAHHSQFFQNVASSLSLLRRLENLQQLLPSNIRSRFAAMEGFRSELAIAQSTQEVIQLCHQFYSEIEPFLPSDANIQFAQMGQSEANLSDKVAQSTSPEDAGILHQRAEKIDSERDHTIPNQTASRPEQNTKQEKLPTWHRKTEVQLNSPKVTMDLTEGTQRAESMGNARVGDDAVSQVTTGRGRIPGSKEQEHSPEEVAEGNQALNTEPTTAVHGGDSARHTRSRDVPLRIPTSDDITRVEAWSTELRPLVHRLTRGLAPWFSPQQRGLSGPFAKGKSIRQLHHIAYEKNVRLFTKKTNNINDVNTAVQLLVDCSGSMYEILPIVQKVSWLLHETLRSLRIPHAITGHYEDTMSPQPTHKTRFGSATDETAGGMAVPHFLRLIDWNNWMSYDSAKNLPQLSAELDNRDGAAIRYVTRQLLLVREQQKILIVLSDGDPSAEGYQQSGVDDTRRAINEARQQGVTVVHVWLSEGADAATIRKLHALYGKDSIVIEEYAQLLDQFRTLLQRLLFASAVRR